MKRIIVLVWLLLCLPITAFAAEPIPKDFIVYGVNASDGSIWAVKSTNIKGVYYWYMGTEGKYLAKVVNDVVNIENMKIYSKNKEVIADDGLTQNTWINGSAGYTCYMSTVKHYHKKRD